MMWRSTDRLDWWRILKWWSVQRAGGSRLSTKRGCCARPTGARERVRSGLLRREGLYASNLITWRRQRETDGVAGLSRKRGRKADPDSGSARKIAQLERTNERLAEKLRKAEFIIEFQKKMAILWASPSQGASEEND